MKALILAPAVALLILGLTAELLAIAESSSQKAVTFASDMSTAMDCATTGRPIRECSPGLFTQRFSEEYNRTVEILESLPVNETL